MPLPPAAGAMARVLGADTEVACFVRNTTEAINVLAAALPAGTRVLSSLVEHHSNMLPWRRHDVQLLPFAGSADELCDAAERALGEARPAIDLVAVTGAPGSGWRFRGSARRTSVRRGYGAC